MRAALEVWTLSGRTMVELHHGRATVGSAVDNDVVVSDEKVSAVHALLERFAAEWCVNDLGSANGTFVNGERIFGLRRLRHDDEIRIGGARLLFRGGIDGTRRVTATAETSPDLTLRERDVLIALCRPLLARDLFTEPASVREIAAELVVSEAAVKQHLGNLFSKFGVVTSDHRRARLANEAMRRGAVTLADLHRPDRD